MKHCKTHILAGILIVLACMPAVMGSCSRQRSRAALAALIAEQDSLRRADSLRTEAVVQVLREWTPAAVVSDTLVALYGVDSCFCALPLPEEVLSRMQGRSLSEGCPVGPDDLRYLHLLHRNTSGQIQLGEMVVHKAIADDVVDIFRTLFDSAYVIERMVLIDDYEANDNASMQANNTSAFCHRQATGYQHRLSRHSYGMAVDINPLYNPYVSSRHVYPIEGLPYANGRTADAWHPAEPELHPGVEHLIITRSSLPYQLFRAKGFYWGGTWPRAKDYQHFEK